MPLSVTRSITYSCIFVFPTTLPRCACTGRKYRVARSRRPDLISLHASFSFSLCSPRSCASKGSIRAHIAVYNNTRILCTSHFFSFPFHVTIPCRPMCMNIFSCTPMFIFLQPAGFWAFKGFILGGLSFNELSQIETKKVKPTPGGRERRR